MTHENPTTRLDTEAPLTGYDAIAKAANLSKTEAWRAARDRVDPLPCWVFRKKILAWPSAIREWRARQTLSLKMAAEIRRVERRHSRGTIGTENDEEP